jgi:predicted aspartyl protease
MPSFTSQVPNMQKLGPIVEVRIAVGQIIENTLRKESQGIPAPLPAHAMIDTGATGTVVSEDIVRQLNLNPVGIAIINTPSSANVQCYEYLIRLLFPNRVDFETLAIATPLKGQHIQCLIGRDVLSAGVFIYTGYMNIFTLSF